MSNEDLAKFLRGVAEQQDATAAIGKMMGMSQSNIDMFNKAAPIGMALYKLAADILESGHEPVAVIERIAAVKPWLDQTEAHWAEKIAKKPE